jgi:signal transduction histidine kinase/ActR/RegA family two-component response regulator
MWAVVTCIRDDHDLRLVVLAALICVVTAVTAFRFQRRARIASGPTLWLWAALVGFVAGSGVWATHFIAMLAYEQSLPIRFDVWLTAASWAIGVVMMCAGFALAARFKAPLATIGGGGVIGAGIVALHFVGIGAIESAFAITWNAPYVVASIVVSCAGAAAALWASQRFDGLKGWIVPAALLVVAIVGLHFTAMTAITLIPDLTVPVVQEVISRQTLAVVTGAMALIILGAAAGVALMETKAHEMSLRNLHTTFKSIPTGLALFDETERLVLWNEACERLAQPFGLVLQPGTAWSSLRHAGRTAAPGGDEHEQDEWLAPDGRWLRVEICPLESGRSIAVLTDITELKTSAVEMAEAKVRAEAANKAKSEFLANMSHEIRTPLNGVLGMAQVMAAGELSDKQRDRLTVIQDSGSALLSILNDILDLSKIQAGRLELEVAPFAADQLAESVAAAFQGAAKAKGIELKTQIDAEATVSWMGDPLRLRQVLSNLIGNAIKFTSEGSVCLEAAVVKRRLVFRVRDTGIGMEPDQIPRLFEKFSQADTSTTRRYGGTGLGLAICEELVSLMEGKITAESRCGAGSCFTVALPLERAETDAAAPEPEEAAPENRGTVSGGLRILAAEDNPTNQLVVRSLLEPLQADITIAADGREAVEAFAAGCFDLVLMDVQMPEMNGIEATIAIREFEKRNDRPRTPILALSASVMSHEVEAHLACGMDGWVAKPIQLAELYAAIEKAIGEAAGAAPDPALKAG